jgi:hypothetical protein
MPIKVPFFTEQDLRTAPLPTHGGRYAVVSHGDVIDNAKKEIVNAGFTIKKEEYKRTLDGQIAQGVYYLDYANDPDMGMMFAWCNSYNRTMRFKCAIGAYVFICSNGVVRGNLGTYSRKHSGTALHDVISEIKNQISNAKTHYDNLVADKELLKNIMLTPRLKGSILGELFANDEILTLTQVGIVKREMDKPTHNYNADVDSAWTMYNHITFSLKEAHPTTFMKNHQRVHDYFINKYRYVSDTFEETPAPIIETYETADMEEPNFGLDPAPYGVNFL